MKPLITANLVEKRTGRVVKGLIRRATEFDLLGWATWVYRRRDEDRDWDWVDIYSKSLRKRSTAECFAAIAAGELQGLMAVDVRSAVKRGVLVDYLATNPTHRHSANRLKYIGTALLAVAVLRSIETAAGGRIYLESLRGAEAFYKSLGMFRQRNRSDDGYAVYAFDAEGAQQFLEQIKEKKILTL